MRVMDWREIKLIGKDEKRVRRKLRRRRNKVIGRRRSTFRTRKRFTTLSVLVDLTGKPMLHQAGSEVKVVCDAVVPLPRAPLLFPVPQRILPIRISEKIPLPSFANCVT